MAYSLDSSGFLDAWVRNYPQDVFGSIWNQMDQPARSGLIVIVDEALRELNRKDDGAYKWICARPSMIVSTNEAIQLEVRNILASYPRLIDSGKNRSGGDPFVVATARLLGYSVITGEMPTGKLAKPKIPDVCRALGIPCLNILEFFRQQKWQV